MIYIQMVLLGTGTSQGIPVIGCLCPTCSSPHAFDKRLRASALFQYNNKNILIDAGPDLRQQLLKQGVSQIDAVAFTHEHQDHTAGLDDLRPLMFKQNAPMPLYCSERVETRLRQQYAYAFENPDYPGVPKFEFHRLEGHFAKIEGLDFQLIHAKHGELPVLGFRLGPFSYLTDLSQIDEFELNKITDSEILVLDCLRPKPHWSHLHLDAAIEIGKRSGAQEVYFTHLSHAFPPHNILQNHLPQGFKAAYDGLKLQTQYVANNRR